MRQYLTYLIRHNILLITLFLVSVKIIFELKKYEFNTLALILAGIWLVIFFIKIIYSIKF